MNVSQEYTDAVNASFDANMAYSQALGRAYGSSDPVLWAQVDVAQAYAEQKCIEWRAAYIKEFGPF